MIKNISIKQYRKLKNICLNFSPYINLISGGNGTCKTSLLHMIGNAFQRVTASKAKLIDKRAINIIYGINATVNPKIETLTKGDKKYNDPAIGQKGTLFTITYLNDLQLGFRRHNSENNRYAVKPKYASGTNDKLPVLPVIYLGLTRLYPVGEFQKDDELYCIKHNLPVEYQEDIAKRYKDLTGIDISESHPQKMGDVKFRNDFSSSKPGVDSNTISAGEENILILLTALCSLKYYYDSLGNTAEPVESLLIIDELDATLHPALQIRLLELFREFSHKYKIQIIATTHSLSLLEYALRQEDNVLYLCDDITNISVMEEPDIFKIKMDLKTIARKDLYADKKIPIFSEDEEARDFLKIIFDYWEQQDLKFKYIRSNFYLSTASLGCDVLRSIFGDKKLLSIMHSICILDGDQSPCLGSNIIALPGQDAPEKFIFEYIQKLFDNDDDFWRTEEVQYAGYTKKFYAEHLQKDYQSLRESIEGLKESDKPTKGVLRKGAKKLWRDNCNFIELAIKHWLNNPENQRAIRSFVKNLNILFRKNALYHGINNREWEITLRDGADV